MINVIIPIQAESIKLDGCISSLEEFTDGFSLKVHINPSLNVSEARQQAMDESSSRYICFLDDDSRLVHKHWLDNMVQALEDDPTSAVAFAEEDWGEFGLLTPYANTHQVNIGPAACMLIDTTRLPDGFRWNPYIGLKSGWLGGDFEEVDYVMRLKNLGINAIGVNGARFLHSDRISMENFSNSDRAMTSRIMFSLIGISLSVVGFEPNPDFFRKLEYVKANSNNDRTLASGKSLKDCYNGVISDNHLERLPMWKRLGLI